MPDELVRFTGTATDDEMEMTRYITAWRTWRAARQAWLDEHAPGARWVDLEAERRCR
jgi:hypothetical protein